MSVQAWREDSWCVYLPDLHRLLADPETRSCMPTSFISLDFEHTCAWWETLRYLFRALIGWKCIPAGLAWWYDAGKPIFDDLRLRLARERWDSRNELDYFAAREWESGGFTGFEWDGVKWPDNPPYEPSPNWWTEFHQRGSLAQPGPYGGGSNPLHLGHSDSIGEKRPIGPSTGVHNPKNRRAALVVSGFGSWRRELREFGAGLPDLGDRSWHVEVFERQTGYLGSFRKSRKTGIWFQGKHSIHIKGNPS